MALEMLTAGPLCRRLTVVVVDSVAALDPQG